MRLLRCLTLMLACVACGRKGPPLPPLVRLPEPPAELRAERRGDSVAIAVGVPASNTDGTRPADIRRLDVYALTGPATLQDEDVMSRGTRIASLDVKAPRDPDDTIEPDEPAGDVAEPEGPGLDQGATASLSEPLTAAELAAPPREASRKDEEPVETTAPALCGAPGALSRHYVAVGVSTRGRRGARSRRATVPLLSPPPPPSSPTVTYSETEVRVSWQGRSDPALPPVVDGAADVLPSKPLGRCPATTAYHVYEVPRGEQAPNPTLVRLTKSPMPETTFADARIEWAAERCYAVATVREIGDASVESVASASACVTLRDTFPPAAPASLRTVASEGAINLIWDGSPAKDLAGYLVLRGAAAAGPFEAVTPKPIAETSYRDTVQSGGRFHYAVQAVDTAGNVSDRSPAVEETAR